jgi:hypothetical protein
VARLGSQVVRLEEKEEGRAVILEII